MSKKNTDKRHNVTCPTCGWVGSVRIDGHGFKSIACRECRTIIHDIDKYFDIVYGGAEIVPIEEIQQNFRHMLIGLGVVIVAFLTYVVWVTYALKILNIFPMAIPHVSGAVYTALVFFGLPYLLYCYLQRRWDMV